MKPKTNMKTKLLSFALLLGLLAAAHSARAAAGGNPPRDPNTPGYVLLTPVNPTVEQVGSLNAAIKALLSNDPDAKAALAAHPNYQPLTPGSANAPAKVDGNFLIGPTYSPSPESIAQPGVPHGTVSTFKMNSTDSKIYPGIHKDGAGTVDPSDPAKLIIASVAAPYSRTITVYVPKQYVPGTSAPLIVTMDGMEGGLPTVLDNMIAQHRLPAMIAVGISTDGSDAQGSERGLEYDTMSGAYADFVETEVLPLVESNYNVKITKDPEGRATLGGSSGGSCALIMAWYHNDLYHRVITYSGTYVNQQWPSNPETPHGAWGFHETLIPNNPAKPIRLWMEVGQSDLLNPNIMRDNMHDWVVANENMVKVLTAKGYHYQFSFALGAGHNDSNVHRQTLPEALEWVWQGYPIDSAK
jgi:enterochelin esterase-like enzyme